MPYLTLMKLRGGHPSLLLPAPYPTNAWRYLACCKSRHLNSSTFQEGAQPQNDERTNFRNLANRTTASPALADFFFLAGLLHNDLERVVRAM